MAPTVPFGAAWVFTRSGSTWTQQEKLTSGGESGEFGSSVALSSEGGTALIGDSNSEIPAAWVFVAQPAKAPTVVTKPASSLAQTSATLNATVNPDGEPVSECYFEYGTTTSYGSSVPCSSLPESGGSTSAVSASAGSLGQGLRYHFRIVATNPLGTSDGSDQTFTTPPKPPTVVTEPASALRPTSATLNATVNPYAETVSECYFEYGTTTSYGSSAPCSSLPGSGGNPVAVSTAVWSLTANTTYHFRIVATNPSGTSSGSDQMFTTTSPELPTVVTKAASFLRPASAILNATVSPNGETVSNCHFEYGTTTSYGSSLPCSSLPGSGGSPLPVLARLTGLSANTSYHFRISATNGHGTGQGSDETFKTLPANAGPHYYRNGARLPEGERVPILEWGQLTFESEGGVSYPIICETASAGFVENSEEGGPGVGQTTSFSSWNCSDTECPEGELELEGHKYEKQYEIIAPPQDLPWSSVLTETKVIRADSAGVVLTLGCYARKLTRAEEETGKATGAGENEQYALAPAVTCETTATHLWEPEHKNGTNAGPNESRLIFNQPAGSGPICAGTVTARISESFKVMGYDNSELITVKNP